MALRLARETGGEIVNADSMQIYRDLRVLTARPSEAEEELAPHHLYGVADGADGWSVGRWLRAAVQTLGEIKERGRTAIVVGGTGLYFRALTQGLAEIPPIPAEGRAAATALWDEGGEGAVRRALKAGDPVSEARIAPGDRQRLVRALEVFQTTGRALGDWQADTVPALGPGDWRGLVIEPPRPELYARCDARMLMMLENGGLDEAAALMARGLDPAQPIMKAVGAPEFARHLRGEATLEAAVEAAQQATRNYAKRQLTWFRNQTKGWPRTAGDASSADGDLP